MQCTSRWLRINKRWIQVRPGRWWLFDRFEKSSFFGIDLCSGNLFIATESQKWPARGISLPAFSVEFSTSSTLTLWKAATMDSLRRRAFRLDQLFSLDQTIHLFIEASAPSAWPSLLACDRLMDRFCSSSWTSILTYLSRWPRHGYVA